LQFKLQAFHGSSCSGNILQGFDIVCVCWFTLTSWRIQAASSEVLILQLKCPSGPSAFITEDEVWLSLNHCCQPSNIHSGRMQMATV